MRGAASWGAWAVAVFLALMPGVTAAQRIKLPMKLNELEKRAQADSNDAAAHYNLALGYWNEKRFDDTERELKLAITIEPRFAVAHLALAYLPFARQPKLWDEIFANEVSRESVPILEESNRRYRAAFLIDPLVDLRIIGAVTPGSANYLYVQQYYGEALALFFQGFEDCQQGKYEDCHGRFVALIREINGESHIDRVPSEVLWYKGIAAAHLGKYDITIQHFQALVQRETGTEKALEAKGSLAYVPLRANEYRYSLASAMQAAGRTAEAIGLYQEVLQNDIGNYMAHVQLASIYEAQRDYPHAVQERMNAINADPDDPSLELDLGVTLGKAGMMPQAESHLRQATEANPRDSRAYFWLGLAEMELGKAPEAREAFTTFLALAPSRYDRQIATAKERLAQLH